MECAACKCITSGGPGASLSGCVSLLCLGSLVEHLLPQQDPPQVAALLLLLAPHRLLCDGVAPQQPPLPPVRPAHRTHARPDRAGRDVSERLEILPIVSSVRGEAPRVENLVAKAVEGDVARQPVLLGQDEVADGASLRLGEGGPAVVSVLVPVRSQHA